MEMLCSRTRYTTTRVLLTVRRTRPVGTGALCLPRADHSILPAVRSLARPALLSFRSWLRSSLSTPGRMHEHISADGLRVVPLHNMAHRKYEPRSLARDCPGA